MWHEKIGESQSTSVSGKRRWASCGLTDVGIKILKSLRKLPFSAPRGDDQTPHPTLFRSEDVCQTHTSRPFAAEAVVSFLIRRARGRVECGLSHGCGMCG